LSEECPLSFCGAADAITIKLLFLIASISALSSVSAESIAPRQMERLGRGVVAVNQGDGKVFVSWRMLGDDPEATAFNLYRATTGAKPAKLNAKPIADVTFFVDETGGSVSTARLSETGMAVGAFSLESGKIKK
jgi:rhamnogalacturonan endolyase